MVLGGRLSFDIPLSFSWLFDVVTTGRKWQFSTAIDEWLSSGAPLLPSRHSDWPEEQQCELARRFIETAPDPVFIANPKTGTIVDVNETAATLLERPKASLRGESITSLHPDGEEERYRALFDEHATSAEETPVKQSTLPDGGQIYVQTSTGTKHPVEINAQVFEIEGEPRITGIFRDITDRKERERELETFEAIVENAGHSIYWTDREGTIEYVNPAFEDLTGYTREEAVGHNPSMLQSGEHDETFYENTWNTILNGEVWHGELVNERKDGTRYVVDQTIAPVEATGDGPDRFVAINTDITERRERERELREFREVVEQAGLAVFMTDTDGTIEYVNPAFEEITEYDREVAVGRNPRILQSGEKDEAYYESLWESVLAGETWEEEIVNRRADGTTYHALQTISPITDETGEPVKLVAIQRDVSDLKAFEAELERQNERLDRFASVVSHDLRNPLNVAKGRLDLALEDTENEHLHAIDSSLERMEALIEDLLELARDGDVTSVEPVSLPEMVSECWQQVETGEATLEVETTREVQADTGRLRRLFENLYRNAIEHGRTDVTITVGDLPDGFYLEDDGPGIPESERHAVFESGYSTGSGTGYGLSIVARAADAHDWEVSIAESETGGARFEFTGVTDEGAPSASEVNRAVSVLADVPIVSRSRLQRVGDALVCPDEPPHEVESDQWDEYADPLERRSHHQDCVE